MTVSEILNKTDHTLLRQTATISEIKTLCDEAKAFQTASVCIPPSFVKVAKGYGGIRVCTVIGFPNGYATTAVKVFEAEDAIRNGADELDVVINLGMVKEKDWEAILTEIRALKAVCGERILKVIVETCLLDQAEKRMLCRIVSDSGAEYIKTSTGFSTSGAQREDIVLFRAALAPQVKIKASGGIRTLKDAEDFLNLGADRLGASVLVSFAQGK
ncbi:MAG: deoxyribose-phosphate aldolase [Evtepia sp.]